MFKNKSEAAGYLAAMIDGEGSVYINRTGGGCYPSLIIYNNDDEILDACLEASSMLGVTFTRAEFKRGKNALSKNLTQKSVRMTNRAGLLLLAPQITLRCPRKKAKLLELERAARKAAR